MPWSAHQSGILVYTRWYNCPGICGLPRAQIRIRVPLCTAGMDVADGTGTSVPDPKSAPSSPSTVQPPSWGSRAVPSRAIPCCRDTSAVAQSRCPTQGTRSPQPAQKRPPKRKRFASHFPFQLNISLCHRSSPSQLMLSRHSPLVSTADKPVAGQFVHGELLTPALRWLQTQTSLAK